MANVRYLLRGRIVLGPKAAVHIPAFILQLIPIIFAAVGQPYLAYSPANIINYILFVILFSSWCCTCFRDPGIIPEPKDPIEDNNPVTVVVGPLSYKLKYCRTCKCYRPLRTSHCRQCGVCISRFDHHCPFVANCVAERNYFSFILMLCSIIIYCLYNFAYALSSIIINRHDLKSTWGSFIILPITPLVFAFVFYLFFFHIKNLIIHGITTYEYLTRAWPDIENNPFYFSVKDSIKMFFKMIKVRKSFLKKSKQFHQTDIEQLYIKCKDWIRNEHMLNDVEVLRTKLKKENKGIEGGIKINESTIIDNNGCLIVLDDDEKENEIVKIPLMRKHIMEQLRSMTPLPTPSVRPLTPVRGVAPTSGKVLPITTKAYAEVIDNLEEKSKIIVKHTVPLKPSVERTRSKKMNRGVVPGNASPTRFDTSSQL